MRLLLPALLAASLCGAQPAFAQALPDTVRTAGVTVAQWRAVQAEVRRAAAARGASERALAAVAERVSANLVVNGRIDLDQVLASIDERAQQVAELQSQLAAMQQADDPAIGALLTQAHAAIEAGDLTRGDQLLEQAAQSDLAGIVRDQARLEARRTRAAQTIAERGRLGSASADYVRAAALYAQAAETTPTSDVRARLEHRLDQAAALYQRGLLFGEPAPLREAVRLYREVALPLAPRSSRPTVWAGMQQDLGNALRALGELGDEAAAREATVAFRAALEVRTRAAAPADWATTQNDLGIALQTLGERGDESALRAAIAAYRAALEVRTRAAAPMLWAGTQNNLAGALSVLAFQHGDEAAMREAITAFRAVLEVHTRAAAPADWAMTQNNLGNSLRWLGERGDDAALREAIAAYRAALEVYTRATAPAYWATAQTGLGSALRVLGRRDDAALREAITAFRAALEVRTRSAAPAAWAKTQFSLSTAYRLAVLHGDRSQLGPALAAARAALEGFEQVGDQYWAQESRRLIADLEAR